MNGIKISVNADNITEILGYYHHELSQHTNDINTIKQHIQTLLEENQKKTEKEIYANSTNSKSNSEQSFSIFIDACNARLEAFAASIKSISQQIVIIDESSHKLKDYVDSKITSFQSQIENIEKSIQTMPDVNNESNNISPCSPKNKKKELKTKSSIKKNQQKRKLSSLGQREKCSSRLSALPKNDMNENDENQNECSMFDTTNTEIQKKCDQISDEMNALKISMREITKNSKIDKDSIQKMINSLYSRLENFVTHNDLEIAISSELEKNRQTIATPAALVCSNNSPKRSIQTPRRKVHVTLINGEALSNDRRQIQNQQIRCSATLNPNYGANHGTYNSANNFKNNPDYVVSNGNGRTLLSTAQGGGYYAPVQYH